MCATCEQEVWLKPVRIRILPYCRKSIIIAASDSEREQVKRYSYITLIIACIVLVCTDIIYSGRATVSRGFRTPRRCSAAPSGGSDSTRPTRRRARSWTPRRRRTTQWTSPSREHCGRRDAAWSDSSAASSCASRALRGRRRRYSRRSGSRAAPAAASFAASSRRPRRARCGGCCPATCAPAAARHQRPRSRLWPLASAAAEWAPKWSQWRASGPDRSWCQRRQSRRCRRTCARMQPQSGVRVPSTWAPSSALERRPVRTRREPRRLRRELQLQEQSQTSGRAQCSRSCRPAASSALSPSPPRRRSWAARAGARRSRRAPCTGSTRRRAGRRTAAASSTWASRFRSSDWSARYTPTASVARWQAACRCHASRVRHTASPSPLEFDRRSPAEVTEYLELYSTCTQIHWGKVKSKLTYY